ncbi:MAG: hypothetical protein AB8H47_17820 [Bacteroidia bacterium]
MKLIIIGAFLFCGLIQSGSLFGQTSLKKMVIGREINIEGQPTKRLKNFRKPDPSLSIEGERFSRLTIGVIQPSDFKPIERISHLEGRSQKVSLSIEKSK